MLCFLCASPHVSLFGLTIIHICSLLYLRVYEVVTGVVEFTVFLNGHDCLILNSFSTLSFIRAAVEGNRGKAMLEMNLCR